MLGQVHNIGQVRTFGTGVQCWGRCATLGQVCNV